MISHIFIFIGTGILFSVAIRISFSPLILEINNGNSGPINQSINESVNKESLEAPAIHQHQDSRIEEAEETDGDAIGDEE